MPRRHDDIGVGNRVRSQFGRYREEAQREPVAVVTHNRVTGYFVSARDYEEYQRLKATVPAGLAVEELDGATLKALAASRIFSHRLNALIAGQGQSV